MFTQSESKAVKDTWVTQSFGHPTLYFSRGHNVRVVRSGPMLGPAVGAVCSHSSPCSLFLVFSLKYISKLLRRKRKENTALKLMTLWRPRCTLHLFCPAEVVVGMVQGDKTQTKTGQKHNLSSSLYIDNCGQYPCWVVIMPLIFTSFFNALCVFWNFVMIMHCVSD